MTPSLQDLTERLIEFRDARDWRQFHGLKNLMLSLNLESAELLELAQWKDDAEVEVSDAQRRVQADGLLEKRPGFGGLVGAEQDVAQPGVGAGVALAGLLLIVGLALLRRHQAAGSAAVVLLLCLLGVHNARAGFAPGDANGDGKVNSQDAALIADYLVGNAGADEFTALLPFAVAMVMFSVGMVFAGRAVDRYGPRKVALVGVVLFGAGYMLSSLMDRTPWPIPTLTVLYGGIVGLSTGFGYTPTITTAIRWFPARKGLASGVVVMGVGLSPVVTAPLAGYLIGLYEVPTTFLLLGVLFLIILVPLALLLRYPPEGWQPPAEATSTSRRAWRPVAEVGPRAMLRSRLFWTAWVLYVLGTAEGFMVIGNAFTIAKEVGLATDAVATVAVMVLALFNSGGRPLFGRLADQWSPRAALLVMYVVLLGAMALLSVSSGLVPVLLGIALTGVVFGGFLAVMPALSALYFGAALAWPSPRPAALPARPPRAPLRGRPPPPLPPRLPAPGSAGPPARPGRENYRIAGYRYF